MAEQQIQGVPVETPLTNTGPTNITAETSEELLKAGLENQANLDNIGTPEDIAIQADLVEQSNIINQANQVQDLGDRTIEATTNAADNALEASLATIEANADIQIQNQKSIANVAQLNIDSQESINQQQLEAANIQRQRAQEDLVLQQSRADEQRQQLIKREERRVAAQRAAAAVRAHMGGMSFSGAGQDYISRVAENAAISMESTIQQFDNNSQDVITQLQRRRDDTEFQYLNVISNGERELRSLRLEMETALNSIQGIVNLSEAEKLQAAAEIEEQVVNRRLEIESGVQETMSQLSQSAVNSFRSLASNLRGRQEVFLNELDNSIVAGTFNQKTDAEIQELSQKTGLSVTEMKARARASSTTAIANAVLASGRNFTPAQVQALNSQYEGYIAQGFTPAQALSFVSSKLLPRDSTNFNNRVATGQFFNLSQGELQQLSEETGLPVADLVAQANLQVGQVFDKAIQQIDPDATPAELSRLRAEYNTLVQNGIPTTQALTTLLPAFNDLTPKQQEEVTGFGGIVGQTEVNPTGTDYFDSLIGGDRGKVTSDNHSGSHDNKTGLDIAVPVGTPVTFPEEVKIVQVVNNPVDNYGKTIVVERANGDRIRYSHLDNIPVSVGDTVPANTSFATSGNTGYVLSGGFVPSKEALEAGAGAHLDIVVLPKEKNPNGNLNPNPNTGIDRASVEQYFKGIPLTSNTTDGNGVEFDENGEPVIPVPLDTDNKSGIENINNDFQDAINIAKPISTRFFERLLGVIESSKDITPEQLAEFSKVREEEKLKEEELKKIAEYLRLENSITNRFLNLFK